MGYASKSNLRYLSKGVLDMPVNMGASRSFAAKDISMRGENERGLRSPSSAHRSEHQTKLVSKTKPKRFVYVYVAIYKKKSIS